MKGKDQNIPSEQELRQWLNAASQGDQVAFTFLLRSHWNKVYTQALTYLKSSEQAQEITQDIFVKLWSTKEKLIEIENFADYLFIISRNQLISALRRKKEQMSVLPDDVEDVLMRPDRQLQYKESYNKILSLIEQLPPVRRKVFTMSRLEGKSYEEIGTTLGISRNGVKDHIVRALNYLRTNFQFNEEKILILIVGTLLLFR